MHAPRDHYTRVGAVTTRYWVEGEGSPVLLLHGLGGFVETWLLNFDALAAEHRVYAVDYLGDGMTDKPLSVSYHLSELARFVKDFMVLLEIERAHVVGQSLGGGIALQMALQYPSFVDRMVVMGAAGLGRGALALHLATLPLVGEIMASRRPPSTVEEYAAGYKSVLHNKDAVPDDLMALFYRAGTREDQLKVTLKALRALGNVFGIHRSVRDPIVRGLPSITKPVLVIWGREDAIAPVSHAQVAEGLPDVRIEILEDCGHAPMLEKPEAFNALVLEFLTG